jgi:AbiV family abortive infection protein
LLEDAVILEKAGRFASAQFLITTADEEMAKSYILLDACRLDFSRHISVLRILCRSFYDHVSKYAYMRLVIAGSERFRDMEEVKRLWEIETTEWWPSKDYESGEPDMPHQTYFIREMPLYVDFVDYNQKWYEPEIEAVLAHKILGKFRLSDTEGALKRLRKSFDAGLYTAKSLAILNDIFKGVYIKEDTPLERIERLYEKTAQQIEAELGIGRNSFFESALHEWPLYHFTTLPRPYVEV